MVCAGRAAAAQSLNATTASEKRCGSPAAPHAAPANACPSPLACALPNKAPPGPVRPPAPPARAPERVLGHRVPHQPDGAQLCSGGRGGLQCIGSDARPHPACSADACCCCPRAHHDRRRRPTLTSILAEHACQLALAPCQRQAPDKDVWVGGIGGSACGGWRTELLLHRRVKHHRRQLAAAPAEVQGHRSHGEAVYGFQGRCAEL